MGVISVADPAHPVEVGHCDLPGTAWNVVLDGAYAYVATDAGGLRVVSIADPVHPVEVGYYAAPSAHGVAARGGYAYVAADGGGLWVLQFYGQGVEESPKPQAPSQKLAGTVVRNLPQDAVTFDAMGRRVVKPKPGVCFVRDAGRTRKVVVYR